VKDATGAVLPGVTVEAASPALIEQVRSANTDANGAYKIENLRPGVYVLTFSLPGFSTVKKEGVELQSNFTATINTELKVGAVEETVTVSGESPVVDVQSNSKAQVLPREVLDAVPTAHTIQGVGQLGRRRDADGARTSAGRRRCSRPTSRATVLGPRRPR
jgi:hypothetical protein